MTMTMKMYHWIQQPYGHNDACLTKACSSSPWTEEETDAAREVATRGLVAGTGEPACWRRRQRSRQGTGARARQMEEEEEARRRPELAGVIRSKQLTAAVVGHHAEQLLHAAPRDGGEGHAARAAVATPPPTTPKCEAARMPCLPPPLWLRLRLLLLHHPRLRGRAPEDEALRGRRAPQRQERRAQRCRCGQC
uniref:Uncharacterized protein n=1 Tax=Oryza meridionalis TaxID=40149 RepID=A0A0E0CJY6_9ORYZ